MSNPDELPTKEDIAVLQARVADKLKEGGTPTGPETDTESLCRVFMCGDLPTQVAVVDALIRVLEGPNLEGEHALKQVGFNVGPLQVKLNEMPEA